MSQDPSTMMVSIGKCRLELLQGDITRQQADVIVNAANSALATGGGVDGAIHEAGGPAILADLQEKYPDGCPTGSAVVSVAGHLSARYVFHAVGPIWRGGRHQEPALLASAYRSCLKQVMELQCHSVVFPAISTGIYGYPPDLAANNALKTTIDFLKWHKAPELVRFVLYGSGAFGAWARALEDLVPR